uniref:Uncharacterized protein n=1 Tax=Setaria viridis TaxID=4556 RepID=A0A4U6VM68_SETVI|nr:hypothetical protein SEVIR_3G349000v2 [Setaria viridis]
MAAGFAAQNNGKSSGPPHLIPRRKRACWLYVTALHGERGERERPLPLLGRNRAQGRSEEGGDGEGAPRGAFRILLSASDPGRLPPHGAGGRRPGIVSGRPRSGHGSSDAHGCQVAFREASSLSTTTIVRMEQRVPHAHYTSIVVYMLICKV